VKLTISLRGGIFTLFAKASAGGRDVREKKRQLTTIRVEKQ
jgi:hypothetical protein